MRPGARRAVDVPRWWVVRQEGPAHCACAQASGGAGRGGGGAGAEDKEWVPVTKLGRLVRNMKIKSPEETYLFSLPPRTLRPLTFSWGSPQG